MTSVEFTVSGTTSPANAWPTKIIGVVSFLETTAGKIFTLRIPHTIPLVSEFQCVTPLTLTYHPGDFPVIDFTKHHLLVASVVIPGAFRTGIETQPVVLVDLSGEMKLTFTNSYPGQTIPRNIPAFEISTKLIND